MAVLKGLGFGTILQHVFQSFYHPNISLHRQAGRPGQVPLWPRLSGTRVYGLGLYYFLRFRGYIGLGYNLSLGSGRHVRPS